MTSLRVLCSRLLGKGRTHAELESEMAVHLALLAADYERRGLSPADALAAARRHFGPIAQLHETYRDQRRLPFLDTLGPQHGYGIARRIEQVAESSLELNQGTIYPALLRLEQKGWIASEWGASENNRKARFYSITRAGRKQLAAETKSWSRTVAMMARLLESEP